MSGTVGDRKRLFRVTAGNLRQNHLYINGHYDFFPADTIGAARKSANGNGVTIRVFLEGLDESIETDIGSDARTGKPRRFFRGRTWIRQFYEHHNIKTGDVLAMERIGKRRYRLYPFDVKTERRHDWHELLDVPLRGRGPTVVESCSLVAAEWLWDSSGLASERSWQTSGMPPRSRPLTPPESICAYQSSWRDTKQSFRILRS